MADALLFSNLCSLMESIADQRGTDLKKRRFERFLYDYRAKYGFDVYDAMRLLLPHLDKRLYQLKESKLAKVYIDALGLGRHSADAQDLSNFKQPGSSSNKYVKSTGDFAGVAFSKIQDRSTVQKPTQTILDVNELLDMLSTSDEKSNVKLFKKIVNVYTAFEQKWLIRIILKDLKMGMTDNSIFQVYHPQAREMYAVCSNLEKVCKDLQDPFVKLNRSTIGLFHPFKPQLGQKQVPKDVRPVAHEGKFYIEEKLDGERIQMHYERKTQQFKWFSRRSTDYTKLYGGKPIPNILAGAIVDCLKADSLVLDGEMLSYDPKLDVFLPFGTLKTSAKDMSMDPHKARPCFVVFDIVYCNGNPLLDYPLSDRIQILDKVVKEKKGYIHLLPRETKSTFQDIIEALDRAMTLRQEGLVIKNPGSVYEPGTRNITWIKLKPDYIDSLNDNCDLLVIGARYGSGKLRGGRLSQFMCAIRDDRIPDTEEPRFLTFCMIGTGYTVDELETFRKKFEQLEPYDSRKQPSWLVHPQKSNENPEVVVDYRRSVVVEVKASEIIWGNMYGAGNTLRFPRFMKFREDKSWQDIMTWSEMNEARRAGTLSGTKRNATEKDFSGQSKKRKATSTRKPRQLVFSQQGVDTRGIKAKSALFSDISFYVVTGDDGASKADLETMIKENGGKFLQTVHGVNHIIAGTQTARVNGIISKNQNDVVLPQWVIDCVEQQDLLSLAPKYMLHTLEKTKEVFRQEMDQYGDSYTQYATEQSLREVMSRIPVDGDMDKCRALASEVQQRYFANQDLPGLIFLRVNAYIDDVAPEPLKNDMEISMDWVKAQRSHELMSLAATQIEFRGGQIAMDVGPGITHVVFDPDNLQRLQELTNAFKKLPLLPRFVTTDWIDACVKARTMVDERPYEPKTPHSAERTVAYLVKSQQCI